MGWCSATEIFDSMAEAIFETKEVSPELGKTLLKKLVTKLQYQDWDCEFDTIYWQNPLVREVFKETNPDWDWDYIDQYSPVEEQQK